MINIVCIASETIGLGHLFRCKAIYDYYLASSIPCRFFLDGDDYSYNIAKRLDINYISQLPSTSKTVVVDGLSLSEQLSDWVKCHPLKILVSPVFDKPNIFDYLLVRYLSNKAKYRFTGVSTIIDSSFSFVTCADIHPIRLQFKELTLGICLGGGGLSSDIPTIIDALDHIDIVKNIKLITGENYTYDSSKITTSPFIVDPWSFLNGINCFIGAEGNLISEALSRGIPTLSLLLDTTNNKNYHLSELGILNTAARNPLDKNAIVKWLSDLQNLSDVNRKIIKNINQGTASALPRQILYLDQLS